VSEGMDNMKKAAEDVKNTVTESVEDIKITLMNYRIKENA